MFAGAQVASRVSVPLCVSSFAVPSSLVFLRMAEYGHLCHHPYAQEDTRLLPSAFLRKCVYEKEPVYLHQTELLPESREVR